MDALGSFLKTALYRVIFVLIVGIPAVEVFSFALFDNGIMIKKIDSNYPSLNSKVIILAQPDKKHPGITEIPTTNTTSFKNGIALSNIAIISNAETRIDEDPRLLILPPNTFKIDGNLFSIQPITGSALMLYLIVAFILGEILCFLGELFIGLFFDWKPFRVDDRIEKIAPQAKAEEPEKIIKEIKEACEKIMQRGKQETDNIQEKVKEICQKCENLALNEKLYLRYFEAFNDRNPSREAAEVHYVLSRTLAGISILMLVFMPIYLLLAVAVLGVILIALKKLEWLKGIICLVLLVLAFFFLKSKLLTAFFLFCLAIIASIVYRAEANKIAKYSGENSKDDNNPT